jgi:hypothetical protein
MTHMLIVIKVQTYLTNNKVCFLTDRTIVRVSILMVSTDEALSYTRAHLLQRWRPLVVTPEAAADAIAANAWDLLIICQSVNDDVAASLALQMNTLHPSAQVMAITSTGQIRSFHSVQFAVNVANPSWLPDAVASLLSAETP